MLSILIVIVGAIAYPTLPVAQYPEIAPPTVVVTATYPGATAETLAETVAAPIEQAINGVEDMIYMSSSSTGDGLAQITVSFKQGTDVDQAQVLVQNRVATGRAAPARGGAADRRDGEQEFARHPDRSPSSPRPTTRSISQYIGNYVTLQVIDRIARLPGVGQAQAFGGRDYNMRIWIDPGLAAARDMTVDEVVERDPRARTSRSPPASVGQPPYGNAARRSSSASRPRAG